MSFRRHSLFLAFTTLLLSQSVLAQVRERPVPFDSAGRIVAITPPLAARLGLEAPLWPVGGDYLDARLYALDEQNSSFVLVVRRPREVLERYPLDAQRRRELGAAVDRGNALAIAATGLGADSMPTYISEPVRGSFVFHQTALGAAIFGPTAATVIDDPAGSTAAYLAITGLSFFVATNLTQGSPVSRAQDHLSYHSAVRGALAANMALYAIAGDGADDKAAAFAALAGGIAGDMIGFQLGKPMTDAEAHGTAHGSTVLAALIAGVLGTAGAFDNDGSSRAAVAAMIGAGALGYPAGLRYVRTAPYRVTAGDVGTLFTSELLGVATAGTLIADSRLDGKVVAGVLTAGFAAGAIIGDRLLVRPYDHTTAEARLVNFGALAGGLIGVAIPVIASSDNASVTLGLATAGAILGTILTENLIQPAHAGEPLRSGLLRTQEKKTMLGSVKFSPEALVLAGAKLPGKHSLFSFTF